MLANESSVVAYNRCSSDNVILSITDIIFSRVKFSCITQMLESYTQASAFKMLYSS